MMTVSGGELLVELLKNCGIEYIFCSPGTEWTPVWEALLKRQERGDASLKYINCRDETLAVSMAQGYAEVTGKLPAVLLHASVGALHGALAIRNAYAARVPMMIISGETYEHRGDEEVRAQGWHWLGLLSDIGGPSALFRSYIKWGNPVKSRDSLVDSVLRGCQIALTAPMGPVYLSIPTEILLKFYKEEPITRPPRNIAVTELNIGDVQKAARQLIQSKKPVIIAEHAGKRPGVVRKLTELAELISIPVFEAPLPYAANFPKDNPLYMGYDTAEALKQADTVMVVGGLTPWYPPSAGPGDDTKIIMIDEAPLHERLPYWGYRADLTISADIGKTLESLVNMIRSDTGGQKQAASTSKVRLESWRAKHDTMVADWEEEALAGKENRPINPGWFLHTARKTLPDDAIILDETLTHTRSVHQYLASPDCYIKSAYGGLGVGMGEAAGVKLANPDRPVILVVGDGSFNYNPVLAALGLYQEYNLPVFIIIMNNGGYRAMKWAHRMRHPEGTAVSRNQFLGTDITPAPDYVKVAEAFSAYGEKLEDPGDIEAALNRGLGQIGQGKTTLLDVILEETAPFMMGRRPTES
jgi:acetolactate synthase-1/2/3 large subunit